MSGDGTRAFVFAGYFAFFLGARFTFPAAFAPRALLPFLVFFVAMCTSRPEGRHKSERRHPEAPPSPALVMHPRGT